MRIAEVARDAYLSADPSPPWVRPFAEPELNVAYRLARHAGTIRESWYRTILNDGLDPLAWVEVVGVVVATIPVVAFGRAIGVSQPRFAVGTSEPPARNVAPLLADAKWNWVPVAVPADTTAAVVQALSALPMEWDNLWQLAGAQYMSDRQMDDPTWNRGTLSRPQMELVAGRISRLRDCFY